MKQPRRSIILTVLTFPELGGSESVINEYWKTLSKKYNVYFLSTPMMKETGEYPVYHLSVRPRFPHPFLFFTIIPYLLVGFFMLVYLTVKHRFKFILAQDGLFTGLYSLLAGRFTGTPVYIMDYGMSVNFSREEYWFSPLSRDRPLYKLSPGFYRANVLLEMRIAKSLIPFVAKRADKVLVTGRDLRGLYDRIGLQESKLLEYHVPIDPVQFRRDDRAIEETRTHLNKLTDGAIQRTKVIAYHAGRLASEKGFEVLLPVLRDQEVQAAFRESECAFLIAGDGPLGNYIKKTTKDLEFVHLTGRLTQKQIGSLAQMADVFLYTASQGGTLSRGVLEAMAGGCMVIATDSPKSHEDALGEGRGLCIPTNNKKELKKALLTALRDKKARTESGVRAQEYVVATHSVDRLADVLLTL